MKISLPVLLLLINFSAAGNPGVGYFSGANEMLPALLSTGDTVYYNDFENGLGDWTAYNLASPSSPSLWHLNSLKSVSPIHSIGWYDTLTNSYPQLSYEALVSPELYIPTNARVYLSFDIFIHLAPEGTNSNDRFDIQLTTNNGATWSFLSQYAYSGQQIGWKTFPSDFGPGENGDLTSYAGKDIRIRFLVSTDNAGPDGEGVFIDNFRILKVGCEFNDPFEPNNIITDAASLQHGQTVYAAICPAGDIDFYEFPVTQNDRINIVVSHNAYQITLTLYNPAGYQVATTGGKQLNYNAATGGIYKLKMSVPDIFSYTPEYSLYLNVINTKPDIVSVTDIPEDEGLKVRIQWQYSLFDPPDAAGSIKEYHLFRRVDDTTGFAGRMLSGEGIIKKDIRGYLVLVGDEYWDYIATIPAISPRPFSNYIYTAPTLKDNSETTFKVAAVSKTINQPVLWGSEGSGISSDNISPEFKYYSLIPGEDAITLTWNIDKSIYKDVKDIRIYKGMFSRFAPVNSAMIIALNPLATSYTDQQVIPGESYYILAATDFAGNINFTTVLTGIVSSVDEDNLLPAEIFLRQNYPNPFNPVTIIEFSVPVIARVSLKIYDILGREVTELVGGEFLPGIYRIPFHAGNLPSGTYFYTLSTGNYSETRKLILMK
jgi:hypothetical protein